MTTVFRKVLNLDPLLFLTYIVISSRLYRLTFSAPFIQAIARSGVSTTLEFCKQIRCTGTMVAEIGLRYFHEKKNFMHDYREESFQSSVHPKWNDAYSITLSS